MRLTLFLVLIVNYAFATSTIDKIQISNTELKKSDNELNQINQKLQNTEGKIFKTEKDILTIDTKLDELSKNNTKVEADYKKLTNELSLHTQQLEQINNIVKNKKSSLVKMLSENLSLATAMKKTDHNTQESVISQEIYNKYRQHNQVLLAKLKNEIAILEIKRLEQQRMSDATKQSLVGIKVMRNQFSTQKKLKVYAVQKLNKEEDTYKNNLKAISSKQDALRETLVKLNILRGSEIEEARKRAAAQQLAIKIETERKKRLRQQIADAKRSGKKVDLKKLEANNKSIQVEKINSSYKAERTYSYQGGKTISPINGASVIKRFGTYEDPVYKIKIFNESITLKAPSDNCDVVSVLNGKVVFAGSSSMLGNVVVVAHAGNLHTVYAGLSIIPSSVTAGTNVPKGYVIGKVAKKLIFEATKNSKHIDPLKLIQV